MRYNTISIYFIQVQRIKHIHTHTYERTIYMCAYAYGWIRIVIGFQLRNILVIQRHTHTHTATEKNEEKNIPNWNEYEKRIKHTHTHTYSCH